MRWQDFEAGSGAQPVDGEEVTFDYVAYNENGSRIDSSYNKGRPASTRLGINGLIPGTSPIQIVPRLARACYCSHAGIA